MVRTIEAIDLDLRDAVLERDYLQRELPVMVANLGNIATRITLLLDERNETK